MTGFLNTVICIYEREEITRDLRKLHNEQGSEFILLINMIGVGGVYGNYGGITSYTGFGGDT